MAAPITTEKIQHWLLTDTAEYTNVTEAIAFDPATDLTTYDPTYKDRLNQPSYVTGKKTSVEFEIDLLAPAGTLHQFLIDNEDEINVETELVRVYMFDEVMSTDPEPVGTGTYRAKLAEFSMNMNPIDGAAGEALRGTGTLSMTSDGWTSGTFDPDTGTFTADS